ncbi:MAG: thioredoxin family protein [Bacteroidales bacterium]|nr:thioredoxin family protein [Bacteroidales bacterium]
MQKNILILFILMNGIALHGQSSVTLYNPDADADAQIKFAVSQAQEENKQVLIQVGGNWCKWCIKLHHFILEHSQLDSIIQKDYVLIRINYSKENRNPPVMKKLDFPQRFGFPVLVVLDKNGKRLHTQDTGYLEENGGYSEEKIKRFLLNWNSSALNAENYK